MAIERVVAERGGQLVVVGMTPGQTPDGYNAAFSKAFRIDPATGQMPVYGSNDGALYKVAAKDGTLLYRFETRAEVSRRPVRRGNTLYAVNANDTLIALDSKTGKMKWNQHRTPAFGMEIAGEQIDEIEVRGMGQRAAAHAPLVHQLLVGAVGLHLVHRTGLF